MCAAMVATAPISTPKSSVKPMPGIESDLKISQATYDSLNALHTAEVGKLAKFGGNDRRKGAQYRGKAFFNLGVRTGVRCQDRIRLIRAIRSVW